MSTANDVRMELSGKKHDGKGPPPADATVVKMACQAETSRGYRCRKWAKSDGVFCIDHSLGPQMGTPFRLLLTARSNDSNWTPRFEQAGARWLDRDDEKLTAKHEAHAGKFNRAFLRYQRRTGDSGVEIFAWTSNEGSAWGTGIPWVDASCILDELHQEGYRVTDAQLYKRDPGRDRDVSNFRIEYTLGAIPLEEFGEVKDVAAAFFGEAFWGLAHPWANPPWEIDPQQLVEVPDAPRLAVIDTINLKFRSPKDQNPPPPLRYELQLMKGLWGVRAIG